MAPHEPANRSWLSQVCQIASRVARPLQLADPSHGRLCGGVRGRQRVLHAVLRASLRFAEAFGLRLSTAV